jgi:Holliday junction DNA helicase RuvB
MNFPKLRLGHLWSQSNLKHKDIFSEISGHDDIKWLLNSAISSEEPVHILLVGKPGLAKTAFLEAIEREYEDSYMALGSGMTGAGMVQYCFEHQPRYLLVDEIETLKQSDQAALLSLMQSGVLIETKVKSTRSIRFKCSVFATSNDTKRLRAPLLSRFAVINIPEYDKEQFISFTKDRLGDNPLAEYIAEQVWVTSKQPNIRDCVRLGSLCQTEQDVLRMLRMTSGGP